MSGIACTTWLPPWFTTGSLGDTSPFGPHDVWGSHLGLALLDERGETVAQRLPLPIMTIEHAVSLPQDEQAYEAFKQGPHFDEVLVLHGQTVCLPQKPKCSKCPVNKYCKKIGVKK